MVKTRSIPDAILTQHLAVLGKTGSGKTSTAKLAIEQVVADGARVCVLDPIKSDWWGLTSSANGKHAGLPFHILGGPRGHVPLHSSAGKAIGEIVATGALPLSIIDMADFEPGGQAKFFVDFAPTLIRKMRGVVYLVIEEAHLFAPKERSGVGAENLSIHWSKTLATAGRSKGIRLLVLSQRVQALHNAVLGSCDTLIAHRLTTPADQEPVVKWLKANTTKDVLEQVSSSLSSLKTGHGWICSGEAKLFEQVAFPRISTYDNTATPTGDGEELTVKTAAVDQDKLRSIIGDAVKEAEASDPKALRRQLAEKDRRIKELEQAPPPVVSSTPTKEKPVLTAKDREVIERLTGRLEALETFIRSESEAVQESLRQKIAGAVNTATMDMERLLETGRTQFLDRLGYAGFAGVLEKLKQVSVEPPRHTAPARSTTPARPPAVSSVPRVTRTAPAVASGDTSVGKVHRAFLTVLANRQGKTTTRNQLAVFSEYSATSRHVDNTISACRTAGWLAGESSRLTITDAGLSALGPFEELPTGEALRNYWIRETGAAPGAMLRALCEVYPKSLTRDEVAEVAGYSVTSRHVDNSLSYLRTLELISGSRDALTASEELFG